VARWPSSGGESSGPETDPVASAALDAHKAATTAAHAGIVAADDVRLADARMPIAHRLSHGSAGVDPLSPADIGAVSATLPTMHEVGAVGEPAFENGYANGYQPSYDTTGFYKDPFGTVHLKGLVTGPDSPPTIFTLPVGFRVRNQQIFRIVSGNTDGEIMVQSNGQVQRRSGAAWYSLSGISFRGA
jgi:hypothetical protein